MSLAFEKTPHISLSYKLVPVQYREYEYGQFKRKASEHLWAVRAVAFP